jgi:formate/nitrite transporter FocA (FNT family)
MDEKDKLIQTGTSEASQPSVGTRFSAGEIYENVRVAAEEELHRPGRSLFWSAVAAGLTIGFSFFAGAYLSTLVPEDYRHAASSAGYPLGFIFVVIARNQLFTENTLEPIIPLLSRPGLSMLKRVLTLWLIVLMGNLAGAVIFAFIAARTPIMDLGLRQALSNIAEEATSGGFVIVGYRAIFAGWLVALMAWLVSSTRSTLAQILLIWLTTAPIAALGFKHSIAGSVEAFYLALAGTSTWQAVLLGFIAPALIGNIVGGVVFVALLNHGQVAGDSK